MNIRTLLTFLTGITIFSCTDTSPKSDPVYADTQPEKPSSLEVLPVKTPLTIDGKLNEEIYSYAPLYEMKNSQTGEEIEEEGYQTHIQILHDNQQLYIAYTCYDRDIHTSFTQRDEHLWEEEVVEVFIDVDEEPNNYVEIEVSPTNVLFDSFIVDPENIDVEATAAYDMQAIQTGVHILGTVNERGDLDTAWTVEIAIPFDELVEAFTPEDIPSYEWKINFYRLNLDGHGPRAMAYSPTQGSFHQPDKFVSLNFLPGTYATYEVHRLSVPLEVDGTGSNPAWDEAVLLSNFRFPWQSRSASETEFRALWDAEFLYFQFVVTDEEVVLLDKENTDRSVTSSDRVELFFATDDRLEPYYSLEMDPKERVFDSKGMLYRNIDATWDWDELETYATLTDNGYILEGKIPLTSFDRLGLWQDGEKRLLKTGVFRAEFSHNGDNIEHSWISWIQPDSPKPDFHIPSAFGYFVLVEE